VNVLTNVSLIGYYWRAGMKADPQVDVAVGERVGHSLRCCDRSWGGREGEEEGVSLGVHLDTTLRLTRLAHDASMLGECVRVCLCAELAQKGRRSLNVGEEKSDGAGREIRSRAA